jgi:hypothetical protein
MYYMYNSLPSFNTDIKLRKNKCKWNEDHVVLQTEPWLGQSMGGIHITDGGSGPGEQIESYTEG